MALNRTAEDSQRQSLQRSIQPSKRPYNFNTVEVPTKLNDGGSPTNKSSYYTQSNRKIRVVDITKERDPFLFFSIVRNVSNFLSGEEDYDDGSMRHGETSMADADMVIVPSKVRKTRISCEAHPHIFFESIFLEIAKDI